jgi:hypothetical protein
MERIEVNVKSDSGYESENNKQRRNSGRAMGGLVLIAVGAVILTDRIGYEVPHWLLSWKMLPIVIGLYIGARHSFKGFGWLIPVAIGTFLILADISDVSIRHIILPLLIIGAGVFMIFKPKGRRHAHWRHREYDTISNSSEDYMEAVTIFGSLKKNVISKTFKGGESVCVFGGSEINLMQADIEGRVAIEIVQVFGGTKLVIPANWQIHSEELVSVFGGLEDKRPIYATPNTDTSKVLVLTGTCIFGGIDIRSY